MVKEPPVYAHAVTRLSLVSSGAIKLGKNLLESAQWLQCQQSGEKGDPHSQDIDQEGSKENQQATVGRGDYTPPSILTKVEFTEIYLHRGSGIYLLYKL